jgi:hypothetical protein
LAYALKANECPQILFLRGNRILYREKGEIMTSGLYDIKRHDFAQMLLKNGCVEVLFRAFRP